MNPFYNRHQQNQQSSPFDLNAALQNLSKQVVATGMTPEQIVRQKIQNGEMTQAQFQQYSQIADRLMGRK